MISGVALEVRSLCVHSVIWAANPYPLNAYMHCAHSQRLETQNPEALSPTTYWDTGLRSIDAKLPWNHSRWQPLIQRRMTDLWLQTPPFTPSQQTTFCCPQLRCNARPYKHTFSLPDAHSLFYMPISLRLRPLRFSSLLDITLHNNCIKRLHNCSTKSLAQRRDSTTSQAAARTKQKKPKLTTQNAHSLLLSSPSNRHHLPPNLPAVFSLASYTSFPCTVTSFMSPKIINPLPSLSQFFDGFNS